MVHYFDSTDHMVFNDVGIPGVTFTNWPDEYIHSSDDDLWQIDSTQLARNAVAVAGTALYLANLSDADAPTLLAVMAGEARERISHLHRDLVRDQPWTTTIGRRDHGTNLTQGTCFSGVCHTAPHGSNFDEHLRY